MEQTETFPEKKKTNPPRTTYLSLNFLKSTHQGNGKREKKENCGAKTTSLSWAINRNKLSTFLFQVLSLKAPKSNLSICTLFICEPTRITHRNCSRIGLVAC